MNRRSFMLGVSVVPLAVVSLVATDSCKKMPLPFGRGYPGGERGPELIMPARMIDPRGAHAGIAQQIAAALRAYDRQLPVRKMQTTGV